MAECFRTLKSSQNAALEKMNAKKKKNYSTPNSLFPIEINIFFKPIPARGRTAALLLVPQPALRMICDYTDNKKPAITSIEKTFMK